MNGGIRIRTELGEGGRTRVVELAASAPFAVKLTGEDTVHIVGAAAYPLDGDHVTIDLSIGRGTSLTVKTVAATMAWPSRIPQAPSVMEVRAWVGADAALAWLPEPIVPVRGCHHELRTRIDLDPAAQLLWREEFILGRAGEGPGTLDAHTRIERGGTPLLHQHLAIDGTPRARHLAPGILGDARATGTLLAVGPGAPEHWAHVSSESLRGAVLELEGGGRLASASAASASELRRWLDEREAGLTGGGAWPAANPSPTSLPEVLTP